MLKMAHLFNSINIIADMIGEGNKLLLFFLAFTILLPIVSEFCIE